MSNPSKVIEQAIWDIWSHCRRNKDNLDSHTQCGVIQTVVEGAVNDIVAELTATMAKLKEATTERRALRKTIKASNEANVWFGPQGEKLKGLKRAAVNRSRRDVETSAALGT
jgi:hypothetical protein